MIHQSSAAERETVRCAHCHLNQFRTSNDVCRRCGQSTAPEPEPPAAEELATDVDTFSVFSGSAEEALILAVAQTVKRYRDLAKLSQLQLAKRYGVPRTYISKIENARCVPTLGGLARVGAALGVTLPTLVLAIDERRLLIELSRMAAAAAEEVPQ